MNAADFDRLTHALRGVLSRRGLMRGLALAGGLAAILAPGGSGAGKKSK